MHSILAFTLIGLGACDFDIPEKFEMPTWYLDLKIPLFQNTLKMEDLSNPEAGIFSYDSLGFQIIQSGSMP
ncbi:MAG: hypothetical protein ACKVHA_08770, partial [Fidelibacterota bacterium]